MKKITLSSSKRNLRRLILLFISIPFVHFTTVQHIPPNFQSGFSSTAVAAVRRNLVAVASLAAIHRFLMDDYLQLFVKETTFYNQIVLGTLLPEKLWTPLPHTVQGWLRNYIAGTLLYFISGFLWCLYIYHIKRNVYLPKDAIPSKKAMYLQIYVAMKAMPWYCVLPTISEYMVESGWTRCFPRISDIGWASYILYLGLYLIIVEFGIYWMHRELHDIKPLYKYLHATHHIYNKQNTLSPFAGLAFHPLDGILQAVPHVIALFLVPTHFRTHIGLLFMEAIWTANIHDCIHGKLWPVMGAGYHTIHHTTYRHNYGHYTVWMDWMFGTLRDPLEDERKDI